LGSPTGWSRTIETGFSVERSPSPGGSGSTALDTIKLTGRKTALNATLWVDPRSYLPVRLVSHERLYLVGGSKDGVNATLTIDFRWLPPTRANRKQLTAPIPKGFREVSSPRH
jgi:hypothetical protein